MSSSKPPTSLTDLPSEILLDHLLPELALKDLSSISCLSKQLHGLSVSLAPTSPIIADVDQRDEALWRRKIQEDFAFTPSTLALDRSSPDGWARRVYLGMKDPRVFVWGSADNGRLGITRPVMGVLRHHRYYDVPVELTNSLGRTWRKALSDSIAQGLDKIQAPEDGGKEIGVVELQAGGWSFTARDMAGGVWVWGQLDGLAFGFNAVDWSDKHCQCPEPTRLPLPCKAQAISASRRHLLVLDADNLIWELTAWGRAYHHTAAALTSPLHHGTSPVSTSHHVIQISTGWSHSACLTSTGSIHVWFPFSAEYTAGLQLEPGHELGDEDHPLQWGKASPECVQNLEAIPSRPIYRGPDEKGREFEGQWDRYRSTNTEAALAEGQTVVKIASGLDFLIALKKNGEVWFTVIMEDRLGPWEYLPFFSSPSTTHITAQYESLTTYSLSPSRVSHTSLPPSIPPGFGETLLPDHLPSLQDKGVIQVALGDYHFAALTKNGEIYTWGEGSKGQLGLGRTESKHLKKVDAPVKVEFGEDVFAWGIAAAGWHTGALVLGGEKRKKQGVAVEQGEERVEPGPTPLTGGPPLFRVGFAGRGANRAATASNVIGRRV